MRRPIESQLYQALLSSEFQFIERGIKRTEEIYEYVYREYINLCDNDFHCNHYRARATQPEWNHVVRSALDRCKTTSARIDYSKKLKYWIFV